VIVPDRILNIPSGTRIMAWAFAFMQPVS
jgi:hypothetical protein